jgi:hypothetical protein
MPAKPVYPVAYDAIREELTALPQLWISNPRSSGWVYLDFEGRRPGATLRYRLADRWVELALVRGRIDEAMFRSRLATDPLAGAEVAPRGRTELVLWTGVPVIDSARDTAGQRETIRSALAAADALREWYLRHADAMHVR